MSFFLWSDLVLIRHSKSTQKACLLNYYISASYCLTFLLFLLTCRPSPPISFFFLPLFFLKTFLCPHLTSNTTLCAFALFSSLWFFTGVAPSGHTIGGGVWPAPTGIFLCGCCRASKTGCVHMCVCAFWCVQWPCHSVYLRHSASTVRSQGAQPHRQKQTLTHTSAPSPSDIFTYWVLICFLFGVLQHKTRLHLIFLIFFFSALTFLLKKKPHCVCSLNLSFILLPVGEQSFWWNAVIAASIIFS